MGSLKAPAVSEQTVAICAALVKWRMWGFSVINIHTHTHIYIYIYYIIIGDSFRPCGHAQLHFPERIDAVFTFFDPRIRPVEDQRTTPWTVSGLEDQPGLGIPWGSRDRMEHVDGWLMLMVDLGICHNTEIHWVCFLRLPQTVMVVDGVSRFSYKNSWI